MLTQVIHDNGCVEHVANNETGVTLHATYGFQDGMPFVYVRIDGPDGIKEFPVLTATEVGLLTDWVITNMSAVAVESD